MAHLDQETLSLLALGEDLAEAGLHLDGCDECRVELAALQRVVAVGRALVPGEPLHAEPPPLWPAIAAELGLAEAAPPAQEPGRSSGHRAGARPAAAEPADAEPPAPPVPLRRRGHATSRGRVLAGLAAAACVVVLAVAVRIGLQGQSEELVAEVTLAPLEGTEAPVTARLVREGDTLGLRLELDGLPREGDAYYEVWLATEDLDGLVSLGPLTERGVQPVPPGLALADFPVVDVSEEAFDGDPSHSGVSLYRGRLQIS